MNTFVHRTGKCVRRALPKAGKTCLWLLKIILPVSLGVQLLRYAGWLDLPAQSMEALFALVGLPGETALVFLTSVFCPLYAPLALIASLDLNLRQATLLSLMCLVAHNLPVESSVQARTGSRFWEMTLLRLVMSFVIAFGLNQIMPQHGWGTLGEVTPREMPANLPALLAQWLADSSGVVIRILLIVTALMILHHILEEFRLMHRLSTALAPLMRLLGLPPDTAFLWLVGNLVGLAYGGAVMVEQMEQKQLTRRNGNLLNYHLAVNHSMLEDTLIFVAIGIPAGWILLPRLLLACVIVWMRRLYNRIHASQKKKTRHEQR
ncbi:MAG: nucleoside recognition domain-containing protein [Tannerellaceae bacterium]|jgi:hypothetical protein|nr:nucleoside recognition domain-containing protein [Tannerellaceae bacterium]